MGPAYVAVLLVICAYCSLGVHARRKQPHIVHILVDDLGWAEVGYHNPVAAAVGDIKTPNIDKLARTGLQLDRFYAEKICSPSRCSLLTGRHAIHVNVQNVLPELTNPNDTDGGYQGIAVNMTGMATKLKSAGYSTHLVGKWDAGMATEAHSPRSRGFDTWLGYWHHSNDYWTQEIESCPANTEGDKGKKMLPMKDLWRTNSTYNGPETALQNDPECSQENQLGGGDNGACVYEEQILVDEVKSIITTYAAEASSAVAARTAPLFLFYSMHLVHMPLQVQQAALDEFSHIENEYRRSMHAMVSVTDRYVGEVVQALKDGQMWDDTLLVLHTDNGGEIMTPFCGGNNYPLRGGKFSAFEGGVRVNALVSGGALPPHRRGKVETNLMSVADWYATYGAVAGLPAEQQTSDDRASAAGLPGVDSKNCWSMIAGRQEGDEREGEEGELPEYAPCRDEIPIGDTSAIGFNMDGNTLVGGLIQGRYKLVLGAENKGFRVDQDVITGVFWPNNTDILVPEIHPRRCTRDPVPTSDDGGTESEDVYGGCLFDVYADPSESHNLASTMPDLFASMLSRIDEIQATVYSPDRGTINQAACAKATTVYGNYWGPFIDL